MGRSPQKVSSKSSNRQKPAKNRPTFILDDETKYLLQNKYHYEVMNRIGAGAFSQVFRGAHMLYNFEFAVKIIDPSENQKLRTRFLPREINILSNIRHTHIIRIFDIFRIKKFFMIFMEFASKGDLTHYLKRYRKPLEDEHACKWFYQTSIALEYLHHEKKIAHRDIKIDNILIVANSDVKLADFGFSTVIEELDDRPVSVTFCGTRSYLPPQILLKRPYNPFKADTWAMGVVLFTMLNNRYPFHHKDRRVMIQEQFDKAYLMSRFASTMSDHSKDIIMKMLDVSEESRLDIKDILKHKWMTDNYNQNYVINLDK